MTLHFRRATAATLMTMALGFGATSSHADIAWRRDIDAARAEAQRTGKPIMIDFYTDWCGWCKRLDKDVYPNPNVQSVARNFIMVKLNAEAEGIAYANYYRVTGYPTTLFLDSKSQYLGKFAGYTDPDDMARRMKGVLWLCDRAAALASQPTAPSQAAAQNPSLYRAPQAQRQSTVAKRSKFPGVSNYVSKSGDDGVLLLDDTGVVALDAPAPKKKPVKAAVKKKG